MASYVSNLSRQADFSSVPRAAASNLSRQADFSSVPRAAAAMHDCFSLFRGAVDNIRGSLRQMRRLNGSGESLRFQLSNVQTDGFQDVPEGTVKSDVCDRAGKVKEVTSNALALVNSYVKILSGP